MISDSDSKLTDGGYWVRFGVHGQIERLHWTEPGNLSRLDRVVCRTSRGVEVGEVLAPVTTHSPNPDSRIGPILRRMRPEDELLWGHLQQLGRETLAECDQWLRNFGIGTVILDVEPLLDGKTLYFHFLTEVGDQVQQHLDELVSLYEQQVHKSKFAKLLERGCGPSCGSKDGCGPATSGKSQSGCAVCKVAGACASS